MSGLEREREVEVGWERKNEKKNRISRRSAISLPSGEGIRYVCGARGVGEGR